MKPASHALLRVLSIAVLLAIACAATAQSPRCSRPAGPLPLYERIFLPKGDQRGASIRGVDELDPAVFADAARLDALFANTAKERTNKFFSTFRTDVSLSTASLKAPGPLISGDAVDNLLRDSHAVPRDVWANHVAHLSSSAGKGRYIFTLTRDNNEMSIDLRPGGCGIIFFPDKSYRCFIPANVGCAKKP